MASNEIKLTVYSRQDCHLCDQMLDALLKWQRRFNFSVDVIDIDKNTLLIEKYAGDIPVLYVNETRICHYHLDEQKLLQNLKVEPSS